MAKNYATIYASTNDVSSLEQAIFIKAETTRGTIIAPTSADFLYTLPGSIEYSQPIESSPHRSGRHHTGYIKQKKELSWSLPLLFNIDTTQGSATSAEVDPGVRVLYKSTLGKEVTTAGAVYTAAEDPSVTFSLYEVGDKWARQCRGCFVNQLTMTFPGDGMAQAEFSGMGKDAFLVGIGKSTVNNNANTVTLESGEGKRFPAGSLVMIVKDDGTTRSTDTPNGSPRTVSSVAGDVVTVSGAALTDADGSTNPVYLCYYEPTTKTAINNPQTGLVGSVTIASLSSPCVRSATITISNDHEVVNYEFGEDSLSGKYFNATSRMTASLEIEMNLGDDTIEFFNSLTSFTAQDIQLALGDTAGRHLLIDMPQVRFSVPSFTIPESGSVPVTFSGTCEQTALDAYDEITVSFI